MSPSSLDAAEGLLERFYKEEGFEAVPGAIRANLEGMAADPGHWVALAFDAGVPVAVATLTTAIRIETGRLGEIGDLYVLPAARARGIASDLVRAVVDRARILGCSAVIAAIEAGGETRSGLARFYQRLGFDPEGRNGATLALE